MTETREEKRTAKCPMLISPTGVKAPTATLSSPPSGHSPLRAKPGDDAEVLEVLGENGTPSYLVRWEDGHESEVFPGPDIFIQRLGDS